MGTKKDYTGPADTFDRDDAAIDLVEGVTRKGAANPYTSGNGWMASYLGKQGEVAIRLGTDDLEQFLAEHDTERRVSHGAVKKDFALVPDAIVADAGQLAAVLRRAHAHVDQLQTGARPDRRGRRMILEEVVLVGATLLTALVAGLLFAFAVVAMPGIGTLGDRSFLRAFRAIDRIIQDNQPIFIVVWAGSGRCWRA